ncbi:biotin--[acetyl-CoA-carboxylase] ligase [Aliifodinibius sp. S!AR15-10]|uniref:biotin--[acetyl-CoA-carboxylase] ligase n=1 Tax=Aliifodinibius sp. S!AR15-10 TaxID=2950437 RepID=UPI00285919C5|nr:biotin--[acetyl-CoA-carboxylase] ligase [Aliifodinibius sp. S!AR15-10]MDR8394058.1 biotin--[acetyl-CoA-carboxylase] ligase [Aliifodinibius sp. S!AR15-10]
MFDVDQFKKALQTQWVGHEIRYFEKLESTNSHLKTISSDEISHGMICLADDQTKGRGQYERNWESMPGQNLTFTMVFKPGRAERLHVLTLACAYATAILIEKKTSLKAQIKWPNDLIVNRRKIAGLLTETVFSGNRLDRVLVGIGFNINQESFGKALDHKATSLKIEDGSTFEREKLLAEYLNFIEYCYTRWHQNDTELLRSINQKLIGYGEWITLSVNGQSSTDRYKLLGINEKGQLTVINQEAGVETFSYEQIRLIID